MTSAQQAGFDAWLIKTYLAMLEAGAAAGRRRCLRRAGAPRLQSGRLAAKPAKLVNPPSDPALKPQAKSVMAAVQSCNPLPVPAAISPVL